jgi:hypothetical protein
MKRSRALLAIFTHGMFGMLGCRLQAENDHAEVEVSEEDLGQAEQPLTSTHCGLVCPGGMHPTQTSCNLISCSAFGSCNNGFPNQVQCASNSGTFNKCGTGCPSGWQQTQTSCNLISCKGFGECNNGSHNQATCTPICDPKYGTHDSIWIVESAESQYVYSGGWCSIGTNWPAMCWEGTYYYEQSFESGACISLGSGGSCYNSDAWWRVTCNARVDCVYDCSGTCQQTTCYN